jgi:hypothetical protein
MDLTTMTELPIADGVGMNGAETICRWKSGQNTYIARRQCPYFDNFPSSGQEGREGVKVCVSLVQVCIGGLGSRKNGGND